MYKSKLTSPEEAVKLVKPSDCVMIPFANGIPPALLEALASRLKKGDLRDIHLFGGLNVRDSSIYDFDLAEGMLMENNFLGQQVRQGTQKGVFTFSPLRLSEFVPVMLSRQFSIIVQTVSLWINTILQHRNQLRICLGSLETPLTIVNFGG